MPEDRDPEVTELHGRMAGERTAVALHYRQGMKVSDVAHALGVTSGTVKTLLFRARRKLRDTVDAAAGSAGHRKEPT